MKKFKKGDYCRYTGRYNKYDPYGIEGSLTNGMIVYVDRDETTSPYIDIRTPNGYTWLIKKSYLEHLYHIDEE